MKAAVYNPYWDTLGGGERYSASFVRFLLDSGWQVDIWWPKNLSSVLSQRFSIDISTANFINPASSGDYDLLFWLSDGSLPISFAKNTIIHFQFPFTHVAGHSLPNFLKSRFYKFVVNSEFTKKFIDAEFSVNSQVIYPPVATDLFSPGPKSKIILYVGRFSNLTQSKGQTMLIDTFKKIYKHLPGWKLILAGGTTVGTNQKELADLKSLIRGFPIRLCLDPKFKELQSLYSQASLYWSASGFGFDENIHPTKVEHFGITVVEAMAAGCVPLVTNIGGHREIVDSTENGFLWETASQLSDLTINLVTDSSLLNQLSQSAVAKSKIFSVIAFNQAFAQYIHV